jgi:hypothetical protein
MFSNRRGGGRIALLYVNVSVNKCNTKVTIAHTFSTLTFLFSDLFTHTDQTQTESPNHTVKMQIHYPHTSFTH